MLNKICALVIAYNANEKIFDGIYSYLHYVDYVYVYDNGNSSFIIDEIINRNIGGKVVYIGSGNNHGISKPINIVADLALKKGFKWLLTMDQDSIFNNFKLMHDYFVNDKEKNEIAIYSPAHITGKRKYPDEEVSYPFSVMTSGNILNLRIFNEIGGLDERFFIDRVDHDYCALVNTKGYKIKRLNQCQLVHTLGNISKDLKFEITNHSPLRRYYITRNTFYYLEKHFRKNKKHCLFYFLGFLVDNKNVFLYEKNRIIKFKYMVLGFLHYIIRYSGKL